jgi:signal peptidase I
MNMAHRVYRQQLAVHWGFLAITLVALVVLAARLLSSIQDAQQGHLASASMLPTIPAGATITYQPVPATLSRGEVVVLGLEHGTDRLLASRVVGLPGETVEIRAESLFINGQVKDPFSGAPMPASLPPLHLGTDQYFLLGDNRAAALDSRVFGPVERRQILGVVLS